MFSQSFSSNEQASLNFMAAVTICSDFGAQENKKLYQFLLGGGGKFFTVIGTPSICHEVMGPDPLIFIFCMLCYKLIHINYGLYMYICVCVYTYTHTHTHIYIYCYGLYVYNIYSVYMYFLKIFASIFMRSLIGVHMQLFSYILFRFCYPGWWFDRWSCK